jgi:ankyrin repeat protein
MGRTALIHAADWDDPQLVRLLLNAGADVNSRDTPLITAALLNCTEIVKLLLDAGADVNAKRGAIGGTALMWAARGGTRGTETVKLLLNSGADVNAQDETGSTALMWAAVRGHLETTQFFLDIRAGLNAKGADDDSARMIARMLVPSGGDTGIVQILLDAGANVNIQNKYGQTALTWAKRYKDPEMVSVLVKYGAKE